MKRAHRVLVPTTLVVATIVLFAGAFAVWVNRQALNTDNWTRTSSKLLANDKIDKALGAYLVNQLFTNVDVAGNLKAALPPQVQPVAAPAAAGLKELAGRAAPQLLASGAVQDAWATANRVAHKQLLAVLNGGSKAVSTNGGEVTLNTHALVDQLAGSLGLESQLAAARSKLQGSTGAQARALAQQKLGVTVPQKAGRLVIMRSNELKTAQDGAKAVRHLAIVLPVIGFGLFALAVWLARGRRRLTLRTTGWCLVAIGVGLLLVRRIGGNEVVNSLVKVPSNKPAVHEVWDIATTLLRAIGIAMLVYGLVVVLAAVLAGPTRLARFTRQALAPTLRESPAMAYAAVGGLLLIVIAWGPTPAFRNIWTILIFAGLLALGVFMLRRDTAVEFAGAQHGDAMHSLREWRAARSAPTPAAPVDDDFRRRLEDLERLAQLHDRGELTDEEFASEKKQLAAER